MELTRNHYLIAGVLALLLGIQFRSIETFVLNGHVTHFLATRTGAASPAESSMVKILPNTGPAAPRKQIHPPDWLGWALMSIGSVLVLHSLALKQPGGK